LNLNVHFQSEQVIKLRFYGLKITSLI